MSGIQLYLRNRDCGACGVRDADSTYMDGDMITDALVEQRPGVPIVGLDSNEVPDLILRECGNCSYRWWEIPLNSSLAPEQRLPEPGDDWDRDTMQGENAALRRLVVAISKQAHVDLGSFSPDVQQGIAIVVAAEEGEQEEAVEQAAPYFAPLRKD